MHLKLLLFCLLVNPLYSAAPVVHAYWAEQYFRHCAPQYTQAEKDAFMRGTLFPDIRYLAKIPRTKTHGKDVTLKHVMAQKSSFTAGQLFHTYVDEQRERIATGDKIYAYLKDVPSRYKTHFLKTLEDEFVYPKLNVGPIRRALLNYDAEERAFGIWFFKRVLWHRILRDYFKQSPIQLFKKKAATKAGYLSFSPKKIHTMHTLLAKYKTDQRIKTYVDQLLVEFEKLLQKK